MKIALINDMLVQEGGQERVLRALQELYPEAPTFVLVYDKKQKEKYYADKKIIPTFLQKLPYVENKYQWYLPLMSTAIESLDLRSFDLIISSSSSLAKGVLVKPGAIHLCYCHTPTRYLWSEWHGYVEDLPYNNFIKKILPFYLSHLRNWDYAAAQRVDHFIANSKTVQARIKKYYQKDSHIIYPPVDTEKFFISSRLSDYYLIGGRLVAYKRYDLAIQAFNRLGLPLKIFGNGPEFTRLKSIAKKNIEFLGDISETEKTRLFSECLAFINPQEEDFGITTIEAMAAGRPVIAYHAGGATETVLEHQTGQFFNDQTWEDLADTIIHFQPEKYDPYLIKEHAEKFNKKRFMTEVKNFIDSRLK
ncbi:MAG TPA: glycosyltransferase [bacterium]|nr:glycosyltransferase [bacterium]